MAEKQTNGYIPRLLSQYKETSMDFLKKKLNIQNIHRIPKLDKIMLNVGIGDAKESANTLKNVISEMTIISGQKPVTAYAKKPISNFKIRKGDPVGVFVTLRGYRMYEFLDRFISTATPRIRDFRGFRPRGFDGRGNYNFGITEQVIFPEINYDKIDKIRGMNITIVTSGNTDEEALELLVSLGFPIRQKKKEDAEGVEA